MYIYTVFVVYIYKTDRCFLATILWLHYNCKQWFINIKFVVHITQFLLFLGCKNKCVNIFNNSILIKMFHNSNETSLIIYQMNELIRMIQMKQLSFDECIYSDYPNVKFHLKRRTLCKPRVKILILFNVLKWTMNEPAQ